MALASLLLSRTLNDPARFPVNRVDILGTLDFADRVELSTAVQRYTTRGFYGLDIGQLRADVEKFAWVDRARVTRVWPAKVVVDVEEHEPAARWNQNSLISKRLKVFEPPQLRPETDNYGKWQQVFAPLPQLRGTPGRQAALLDSYRAYAQELSMLGLTLAILNEDDRRAQTLVFSNEVVLHLGSEKHEQRMESFVSVYPKFSRLAAAEPQGFPALKFDMRYSNGFAVGRVSDRGDER
ncbi:MAG: cell division protein FtsQ/DivIB [Granulosicoccus sp.]